MPISTNFIIFIYEVPFLLNNSHKSKLPIKVICVFCLAVCSPAVFDSKIISFPFLIRVRFRVIFYFYKCVLYTIRIFGSLVKFYLSLFFSFDSTVYASSVKPSINTTITPVKKKSFCVFSSSFLQLFIGHGHFQIHNQHRTRASNCLRLGKYLINYFFF